MDKSPDAFRTISEVADALETPAHVLRFWESRFPQIKPVKRAGGRRYYRPADVALLGGIRHLLHDDGMTIRGVQKILREQGVRHVAAMAPGSDASVFDIEDEDMMLDLSVSGELPLDVPETGQVLAMEPVARRVTSLPETPAEVVVLHAPAQEVQLNLLADDVQVHRSQGVQPQATPEGAVDLSEGFMLPTANRRPLPTLDAEPDDDVPEAAHIWVEDTEPEADWSIEPLFPLQAAMRSLADLSETAPVAAAGEIEVDLVAEAETVEVIVDVPVAAAGEIGLDLVAEAVTVEVIVDASLQPAFAATDFVSSEEAPEPAAALGDAVPPNLAGIAGRLRALPQPVMPQSIGPLAELQMRLGLLQAQMAEAARTRK